jgi:L-aspartate oxidase
MSNFADRPVIVGGGLAGLMTALHLAPMPVVVLTRAPLGTEASSAWAQGGVAAAVGADDSPALHAADTIAAGDGLCDADVVRRITEAGPAAIADLQRLGARFDLADDGALALGQEAAHSRRRIVHAGGDATGREIMRALVAAVRATPSITVLEGFSARRLLTADGEIAGVLAAGDGAALLLPTSRVVIATGGAGGLFLHTTNPRGSFGQGLALAARAGAALADMEFVQFHPTALAADADPMFLVSEAVRGEGAILVDERGVRFMAGTPGAELAPRDVVARAIWRHRAAGREVFLDASGALGSSFAHHFPSIAARCAAAGIDPATQPIPVVPAAHYHMGGIAADAQGRTTVPGLWAVGEAACTGLHGANRLASNSLLEAAVGGREAAASVAQAPARARRSAPAATPQACDPQPVRRILSDAVGVLRTREGLMHAIGALLPMAAASDAALAGLMIAVAALHREESRGGHFREDAPHADPAWARRVRWTMDEALAAAREAAEPARRKA